MKGDGSHDDLRLRLEQKPDKLVYKYEQRTSLHRGKHRWHKAARGVLRLPLKKTGAPEIILAAFLRLRST